MVKKLKSKCFKRGCFGKVREYFKDHNMNLRFKDTKSQ